MGPNIQIEYASRTLRPNEKNYAATELECLALVWACKYFRHYLLGIEFTVNTDHHCFCWLQSNLSNSSGRLQRWSIGLAEFNFKIKYIKGTTNVVADCLSRYPNITEHVNKIPIEINLIDICSLSLENLVNPFKNTTEICSISLEKIPSVQREDSWCRNIINNIGKNKTFVLQNDVLFKIQTVNTVKKLVLCCPVIYRQELLFLAHNAKDSGHLGENRTYDKLRSKFYWPDMQNDVKTHIVKCAVCQFNQPSTQLLAGKLISIPVQTVFKRIGIDIIGPLNKTRRQNRFILTIIDFFSKYAIAVPLRGITAHDVCEALIRNVFLIYGAPEEILSDNGRQFDSNFTRELLKELHIKQLFTTAYHPQCNGLAERMNQTINNMLRKYVNTVNVKIILKNFLIILFLLYYKSLKLSIRSKNSVVVRMLNLNLNEHSFRRINFQLLHDKCALVRTTYMRKLENSLLKEKFISSPLNINPV